MERNFTDENFEHFLKQNADGLRMRPTDKVWNSISNRINNRRRKTRIIFGISLLIATALGYYITEQSTTGTHTTINKNGSTATQPSGSQNAIQLNANQEHRTAEAGKRTTRAKQNFIIPKLYINPEQTLVSNQSVFNNSIVPEAPLASNSFTPTIVDSDPGLATTSEPNTSLQAEERNALFPLSIESVVNLYKPRPGGKKLGLQLYFTPTVSYRKLGENKSYLRSVPANSIPYTYPSLYDINNVVTHKPDFGFELGLAAKYPLSQSMKLRGGLQFNVSRYGIKAFNSPYQLATITLNTGNGVQSMNALTTYNNFTGFNSSWLENFYFQVSAPVGLEFKVRGDEKMQFGVATTVQPTYVLSDRAYIISTDYKNYAQIPSLTRRWNVNTSLETFVSYSTGHMKWQVGPQVRYQLLSSFVNKYPVKENLFDFGLKVGISLNKH
ncbi:MAG TPA: hypothetical protein VNS32_28680, partial [Flavisolibacter sp.]|nr:hypothetical protein [Flavisolibacter sp.]